MRLLVTAGPTCEDLDPVRYLTNRSSGRMGYALAAAAAARGHEVVLVSGPTQLDPPAGVEFVAVRSAQQMLQACLDVFARCDAAALVAAVADYRPADYSESKLKKREDELVLRLERTPDIAGRLGHEKTGQVLLGFALESDQGHANAERKLAQKRLDAIVLNQPDTFGADRISAQVLVGGEGWQPAREGTKAALSEWLVCFLEQRVRASGNP